MKYLLLLLISLNVFGAQYHKDTKVIIGTDTDVNVNIEVDRAGSDAPALRWDASDEKWKFSHDGTFFQEMGSGSGGGGIDAWGTATPYALGDLVVESNKIYYCLVNHTSGTFATDLSAGNWLLIETEAYAVEVMPSGNLASTNAQDAFEELQADVDTRATDTDLDAHTANTSNPHSVTKAQVGLSDVDNTSDANKPISTATQTALDGKQDIVSGVDSTEIGYLDGVTSGIQSQLDGKEPAFSILPLSKGGTNKNMTAIAGGIVYTDSDSQEVTAAGISGQVLQSNGSSAPSWVNKSISGKAGTASSVTVEEFHVPANHLTQTDTNKYKLETGSFELLANPSFDHSTVGTGWTVTSTGTATCTLTAYTTAAGLLAGEKTAGLLEAAGGASGGTCSIKQEPTVTRGQNTLIGITVAGAVGQASDAITGYTLVGGSRVTSRTSLGAPGSAINYEPFYVNEVATSTTAGIEVLITVPASNTYSALIDRATVEQGHKFATTGIITPWQAYTPTFTGFGTASSVNLEWRQVGSDVEIRGDFIAGTTTATEARMTLPNNYTSATTGTHVVGYWIRGATATGHGSAIRIASASSYVIFGNDAFSGASVNPLTAVNGNGMVQSGNTVTINVSIPVNELRGSTQVFASQCGANCENIPSARVAVGGGVSQENVDMINGSCTNGSTGIYTCTYNTPLAVPATIIPVVDTSTSAGNFFCESEATSTTGFTVQCKNDAGTLAGVGFFVSIHKNGADYQASRIIQGSFRGYNYTPGAVKPGLYSAHVSSSGVLSDNMGGLFSSCTNATTPVCTIASGKVTVSPSCWHSCTSGKPEQMNVTGTTSLNGPCHNNSNVAISGDRTYFCHVETP